MVKMTGTYTGEKHCKTEHEPSRRVLETDAPKDNQGRGESFSPTDLMATALGTCILTTLAIVGEKEGLDLKNSRMTVEKEMTAAPRRIASLKTLIELPSSLTPEWRERLETAAHNCPVRKSLHPDVIVPIEFKYNI
jgi:uncharacterized OsmC-like protein